MKPANRVVIAAWVVAGCLVASGCGDDENASPPAATATSSPTRTSTVTALPTATPTPTLSATPSPTASLTPTATPTSSSTVTLSPTSTATATLTPTETATASATETPTETATPTPSLTATITPTPTVTNTLGPLGIRHFVLNKSKSVFQVMIRDRLIVPVGQFQGQSNGQTEPAFLDFEAGQPDAEGFTKVNILRASEFIFVDAGELASFVLCIKPLVPVMAAGILGCNGGMDVSISLDQDHYLGELGVDGFTAADCTAQNGELEVPYAACGTGNIGQVCEVDTDCDTSAGSGDGVCTHVTALCSSGNTGAVCRKDADCDSETASGHCGMLHPGVCNGPLVPGFGTGDSGPGEFLIVPNPDPDVQLNGMPVEIAFESALPCGDEGRGFRSPFALTTGISRSMIQDANGELGRVLNFETRGENFSCYDWQENDRGRLVLSAPALDSPLVGDVATIFVFAAR